MTRTFQSRAAAALAAIVFLTPTGCGKGEEAAAEAEKIVSARTAAVTVGPFTEAIDAIGVVVPRSGSVALLSAPAATRVSQVLAVAGQHVEKGAVLLEFEQAPFLARGQSAEAALSAAERSHERAQRLVEAGIAARRELDQAAAELAKARSEAVAARRESQLSRLESPLAGVVTRMTAVLGASVDANQPLVEVADPSNVDILINVTPGDAARIRVGAHVAVATGRGADAQALGTASVTEVGGAIDADTRSISVRAKGSGLARPLRIGESVSAAITVAERAHALSVPVEALIPEGEGFKVFVVDAEGIAHARPVTVGGRAATMAEITKGLVSGERVVTYGAFGVEDGVKIVSPGTEEEEGDEEPAKDEKAAKADGKGAKKDEKKDEKKDAAAEKKKP